MVMESRRKPCFFFFFLLCILLLLSDISAKVHYHNFVIQEKQVKRLCKTSTIITVNGQYPGPTLEANDGDSFVIKVVNKVNHSDTIHWHGVRQMRNGWADGTAYVSQCPIKYGGTYTYKFTIENQEGTFWWHAHSPWLRVTVYGALIIHPKDNSPYPFTKPHREVPIIFGEWWTKNYIEIANEALENGRPPLPCDALLINGQPGDRYACSSKETTEIPATTGETLLLRFINAAMNTALFVSIAGHPMIVVAADGSYTKPFTTSYLMLPPGQTTDALIHTNHSHGRYYIAAHAFISSSPLIKFHNSTATAVLNYDSTTNHSNPLSPTLSAHTHRSSASAFTSQLRSPSRPKIPQPVDENLFIVVGLHLDGRQIFASMNNISFALPRTNSILQSAYSGRGVFTTDFPASPLSKFKKGTEIYKIKYGSVVQVVLQGSNVIVEEDHPMHLHGYNFYVLGTGIGEFEKERDGEKLNMVDPPARSTVVVPAGGWVVIRFVADNPGIWFFHCHVELHIEWGMAMAFWVENGVGKMKSIRPPPDDLPKC